MDNYIDIIKTAVSFFPIISFILSIPYVLYNYRKYGSIPFLKSFIFYTFVLYLISAYFLVILPLPTQSYVNELSTPRVQLIPFKFIYDFINESGFNLFKVSTFFYAIKNSTFYVPLYNIFLTMPFAIYIRYYFDTNMKKSILYVFLLSLFFELTQLTGLYFIYSRGYRLFDVDDLLLNTFGGIIGYFISIPVLKLIPSFKEINIKAKKVGIENVPRFRQSIAILLDIFIYLFSIFVSVILFNIRYAYIYILIIYYFIIPIITGGSTLGEKFLKISIISKNNKYRIIKVMLRKLLFIVFYIINIYVVSLLYIKLATNLDTRSKIIIAIILFGIYFLYYSISAIKYFFLKKEMLYEKISGTKVISMIK